MQRPIEEREWQRLQDVARDYRDQGYVVTVKPSAEDLPEFLAGFDIDLIARSDEQHVVVEVRSRATLPDAPPLPKLAEAVSSHPEWRLDLVVINPEERLLSHQGWELPGRDELLARAAEARSLLDHGSHEAALLLAWSAAEATLRLLAQEHGVELVDDSPSYIVRQLVAEGLLSKKDQVFLKKGAQLRTQTIHGYRASSLEAGLLRKLIELPQRVLQDAAVDLGAAFSPRIEVA